MKKIQIKVKKLTPEAILPKKSKDTPTCFDLFYVFKESTLFSNMKHYYTGLNFDLPQGYTGLLFVHILDEGILKCVGMFTSDQNKELVVSLPNTIIIKEDENIFAKMLIVETLDVEFLEN